jgi:hypothetical protein
MPAYGHAGQKAPQTGDLQQFSGRSSPGQIELWPIEPN